jgi:hypothetical protein
VRLWKGAEGYLVPEVISEQPLSQLRGLGGAIQNFELQKGGASVPQIYKSRLFLKQTIGLGGKSIVEESGPLRLGTHYNSRRLVFPSEYIPRANFRKIYWLSGDYQHIANPGFNAARGPATSSP